MATDETTNGLRAPRRTDRTARVRDPVDPVKRGPPPAAPARTPGPSGHVERTAVQVVVPVCRAMAVAGRADAAAPGAAMVAAAATAPMRAIGPAEEAVHPVTDAISPDGLVVGLGAHRVAAGRRSFAEMIAVPAAIAPAVVELARWAGARGQLRIGGVRCRGASLDHRRLIVRSTR